MTWAGGGNVPPVLALADAAAGARARGARHRLARRSRHASRRRRSRTSPGRCWRSGTAARSPRDVLRRGAHGRRRRGGLHAARRRCAAPRPSCRPSVALVHTLYAANLDGDGGLLPMQMAASVDGIAAVRAELGAGRRSPRFGALLDRQRTLLVTCPEALDLPGPRARQRALRRARPRGRRARTPGGARRASTTVARSSWSGWARRRWTRRPVLQRLLDGARATRPVRVIVTLGDHLDPADLDVPANVQLSGYVRHAAVLPVGIGRGEPRRARHACWPRSPTALPLVCLPLGREQPLNAAAVERVGAGVRGRCRRPARRASRAAVARALSRPGAAGRARRGWRSRSTTCARPAHAEAEVERLLDLPYSLAWTPPEPALFYTGSGGRALRAAALAQDAPDPEPYVRFVAPLGRAGARARLRRRRPAARPAGARPRRRGARLVARHARPLPGQRRRTRGLVVTLHESPMESMELPRRYRSIYLAGADLQPDRRRRHRVAGAGAHPRPPRARRLGADPAVRARARAARARSVCPAPTSPTTARRCASRSSSVERDDEARLQTAVTALRARDRRGSQPSRSAPGSCTGTRRRASGSWSATPACSVGERRWRRTAAPAAAGRRRSSPSGSAATRPSTHRASIRDRLPPAGRALAAGMLGLDQAIYGERPKVEIVAEADADGLDLGDVDLDLDDPPRSRMTIERDD